MTPLLEATDVSVEYAVRGGVLHAVSKASLTVGPGEVVGVVGDSGSGKSTFVLALLGGTRPGGRITSGSVKFEGQELVGASYERLAEVRGNGIGFITQAPKAAMNPLLKVGRQMTQVLRLRGKASTGAEARALAVRLLTAVGIADPERRMEAYPHELSGGMAQRILIAMALGPEPRLLLADEPTSGLDVTLQAQIMDDLRAGAASVGSSLVIVTHEVGVVAQYCDRLYLMNAGEVVEQCEVSTFFKRPRHPASLALLTPEDPDSPAALRLAGLPVDRRNLPLGCYLHPRCPLATAEAGCLAVHPDLVEVEPGHSVRCHRHDVVAGLLSRGAERAD